LWGEGGYVTNFMGVGRGDFKFKLKERLSFF